jgi:hypothetical protein
MNAFIDFLYHLIGRRSPREVARLVERLRRREEAREAAELKREYAHFFGHSRGAGVITCGVCRRG